MKNLEFNGKVIATSQPSDIKGFDLIVEPDGKEYLRSQKTDLCYRSKDVKIIQIIEDLFVNRTRVTFDFGDITTGKSWGDTNYITGRIGRSTGAIKIPLLVHNSRAMGGGALLDDCIVKIVTTKGKQVIYQHPDYE